MDNLKESSLDGNVNSNEVHNCCKDSEKEKTTVCSCCGESFLKSQTITDGEIVICRDCFFTEGYIRCRKCGKLIAGNEIFYTDSFIDDELCLNCYENFKEAAKRKEQLEGARRFFGVSLDAKSSSEDACRLSFEADEIMSMINSHPYMRDKIRIKTDESLQNSLKITAEPMSLEYYLYKMNWVRVLDLLVELGYTSGEDGDSCGLYVQINRASLGDTPQKQNEVICRIIYFIEKYWDKMVVFSRKNPKGLEKCAKRRGEKAEPSEYLSLINEENRPDRYYFVNTLNADVIEFRMFKGTLVWYEFFAAILLVNELCELAVSKTDDEIKDVSWDDFLIGFLEREKKNETLIYYLYKKDLLLENAEK